MRLIFLLTATIFSLNVYAANESQIEWLTDYTQALEVAKKEHKPVILLFTGSDWCTWCKKLEREVLQQNEFASMCANEFIFVKVDFPHNPRLPSEVEREHRGLKNRYGVRGLPKMVMLNEKQEQIAYVGYRRGGPKAFAEHLLETLAIH